MTSTVVFTGESLPEKDLEKVTYFKAYLSQDTQDEIIEQIVLKNKSINIDDYKVSMHVVIEMKKYKNQQ